MTAESAAAVGSAELVSYLDQFLRVSELPDDPRALNGLQVESGRPVRRLAAAVDACQVVIDRAAAVGANMLLVHHGLFWGGVEPLTGRHGRRVRALVEAEMALYSAHIPLDCHPEVGNNAVLAAELGVREPRPFGAYDGIAIGVAGSLNLPLNELADRLEGRLGQAPVVIGAGPTTAGVVAIVTGAGSEFLREARDSGVDTLITGEAPHHAYLDAEEWGINLVLGGHYATETVGVQALARHLEQRYGLPWEFLDHPTGL
ncbi:MAG TPA: Nif3-like dinuclear metal center hexameric protein [Gemmatimonadales bacterium]